MTFQTSGTGAAEPFLPNVSWKVPLMTIRVSGACSLAFNGGSGFPLVSGQPYYLMNCNPSRRKATIQDAGGGTRVTVNVLG